MDSMQEKAIDKPRSETHLSRVGTRNGFSHNPRSQKADYSREDISLPTVSRKRNSRMVLLYVWILIVSLVGLQSIVPLYDQFYLREIATVLLFILILVAPSRYIPAVLYGLTYLIIVYTLISVARSYYYDLFTQFKLFVRLIIFMLPALAVPRFARSIQDTRRALLFVLIVGGLLSLSAPLQELTGTLPWLYAEENWEWLHGRAGFARYFSLYGDPNIAGMLGGVLPLSVLLIRGSETRHKLAEQFCEIIIWIISVLLVAYALSFTGLLIFCISALIILMLSRGQRLKLMLPFGVIGLLSVFILPTLSERLMGTIQQMFRESGTIGGFGVGGSQSNYLLSNLRFRLLAYVDINDTPLKLLFGSTYNVVVPNSYYNPSAILAHNGYKEIFLAGGLIGLGLYLVLIGATAVRAYHLIRNIRVLPESARGTVCAAVAGFSILAVVMLGFPVHHYAGIGIVFWTTVGVIHTFSWRWAGLFSHAGSFHTTSL